MDEDSYRGLSMLENIFKLYSKMLGDRMAKVLQEIQNPHQYGFTNGKSCSEASRTIIDAVQYARNENQPLIVLSTDIFKAFDSVDHNHMERTLRFYKYPEKYIQAFMRCTKNGTIEFEINGKKSFDNVSH